MGGRLTYDFRLTYAATGLPWGVQPVEGEGRVSDGCGVEVSAVVITANARENRRLGYLFATLPPGC